MTNQDLLAEAMAHHAAGRLNLAAELYRTRLETDACHPQTNHCLGLLEIECGRIDAGLGHLQRALECSPETGQYWQSFAEALLLVRRPEDALTVIEQALTSGLDTPDAHDLQRRIKAHLHDLANDVSDAVAAENTVVSPGDPEIGAAIRLPVGNVSLIQAEQDRLLDLLRSGQLAPAEAMARRLTETDPENAFGWKVLGTLLVHRIDSQSALPVLEEAKRLAPQDAEILNSLGQVYQALEQPDKALDIYCQAVLLQPDLAEIWYNQGKLQQESGRLDDALSSYSQAIRLRPDYAKAYNNLGMVQQGLGRLEEALNSYDRAIRLQSDCAVAHDNLGSLLREQSRSEDALACYDRTLTVWPDCAEAFNNRALALQDLGRVKDALSSFDEALAIKPDFAAVWSNRGNVLKDQGRLDEALASYDRALTIRPDSLIAHQNRLLCLNYQTDLARETLFAEHLSFEPRQLAGIERLPPVANRSRDPDRRLRIGMVSADFRQHSVAFFLLPVLERLNRRHFEVYCYATRAGHDDLTQTFRGLADGWIECSRMGHGALAERIRADGIDLLCDLSGHTNGNALPALAAKPAPVQITWIGYPNTTGLSAMDYRLVDAITDPAGAADELHTEHLIRLLHGFLCYRPPRVAHELAVGPPPCVTADRITFGSFNNLAKLTSFTLDLWGEILRAVPDARLCLKSAFSADLTVWERVVAHFEQQGIDPQRLEILPRAPSDREHLRLYQRIDIALDTFPYHGTTTTCEALFMGVPVVTLLGDRHASRVGASLLTQIGLSALIAASADDYVRIAVELATDRQRLTDLRAGLRTALEQSPLCDEAGFTRRLEAVLRQMWRLWCRGEASRVFELDQQTSEPEKASGAVPPLPHKRARKGAKKRKKQRAAHPPALHMQSGDSALSTVAADESPTLAEKTLVLGLFKQERYARAEAAARRLTERYPQHAFGWKALGTILIKSGHHESALPILLEAIRLSPLDAEPIQNLGYGLLVLGRLNEAMGCFKRALEVKPDYTLAHNNLGTAYKDLGRLEEAMDCYDRALEIDPDYAEAYCNRGVALEQSGQLNEAVTNYHKALSLQPRYAQVQNNLGNSYKSLGLLDQAMDCYRQALEIQPGLIAASNNLLFCLNYKSDLSPTQLFDEHRAFEKKIADQVSQLTPVAREKQTPDQVLRIGIVSGDFRLHSVAFFLLPVIEQLDRRQFQVFCYYRSHRHDAMTTMFQGLADGWLDCASLSEQALAERIRAEGIDLLMDLSGHTSPNSLPTFAAKPAPIQITWIGYPNTTGLTAMDYRLVDAVTDPPGEADACHTERLIRLPSGFLCYRPWTSAFKLPVASAPCLASGRMTFGSFNNLAKLTDVTLDLWIEVLRAVSDARLLLKSHTASDIQVWDRLVSYFNERGIPPERLEILPRAPSYAEHLVQYQQIDIALDTFPYHGTTTTCEALFMGVPVVTLMGDRHAARVGGSLLTQAGLPELIAQSVSDYVEIARNLARDPDRLAGLRAVLRERLERSPLCDEAGFTRTLEHALRQMWHLWCAGETPRVFEVRPPDGDGHSPTVNKKRLSETLTPAPDENRPEDAECAPHQPPVSSPTRSEQDELIRLFNAGRHAEAEAVARRLTERYPNAMFGWKALGTILVKSNRHEAALPPLLEANRLAPGNAECLNSLGNALQNLGRLDEALDCLKRALESDPDYAVAYNNLGVVLSLLGRFETALPAFDQALAINPQADDAHLNRALTLAMLRQPDAALEAFDQALSIKPDSVDALNKRGILLQDLGRLDEARVSLEQALAIQPDAADALTNLGNLFKSQGCLDEAQDCYERALAIQPDLVEAWHNRLMCLNYQANIPRDQVFAEHRLFERSQAARVIRLPAFQTAARDPERRLRLGFVSGDLRQHSVAFFLRPVLERLDRERFQIFCYATSARRDEVTRILRGLADGWQDCAGSGSRALANRIRGDAIDLLFDLSGHTEGNALPAFAARPAPVQISWIGYPNTTGLTAMDYRLVDAVTDPPGESDPYHSERLIRLPGGFLCYRPLEIAQIQPVGPPPCLETGWVTFGSFNNLAKLTPTTLELWVEILRRTPGSRLLLKSHTTTELQVWDQWLARFTERGIAPERLEVLPRAPSHEDHLAQYQRIDIALDTFPYHGTTTTCEALFMGVPVVTLMGDRHAARVGGSLLTQAGLPELIAETPEDYIRLAVELAADQPRLISLRASLRERLEQSPLRDEIGFTRTLEAALRQMWRIWCADEPARVFSVPANRTLIDQCASVEQVTTSGKAVSPTTSEQQAVIRRINQGAYVKAEAAARRLIKRYPLAPFGWKMLGAILVKSKQYQDALPILLEANRLAADDDECIDALGSALQHLERLEEALACFERVADMRPDDALAHNNQGAVLCDLGRFNEALHCYDRALAIAPETIEVLGNRGLVMRLMGRAEEALACFDQILAIKPDAIDALNKGAILAQEFGRLDEARTKLDKALAIKPDYAEALTNRGNVLKDQGRMEEALGDYNRALAIKPDLIVAWHVRLLCLNYQTDLPPSQICAEHQAFEQTVMARVARLPPVKSKNRDPERRLRIGFVSGDFRQHSVAFFLMPVLEHLDRQRFEVFCYMTSHHRDKLTQVFRGLADSWKDCARLDTAKLARQVRQDDIDLLLDLSGHTSSNALLAFAARPAPVQITWIGYPNTTGLTAMDYRLVDAVTDPPGETDIYHSERLIRLPKGFLCYRPLHGATELPVSPLPCLTNGRITLGSFNNLAKIHSTTIKLWADVLRWMPGARLRLKTPTTTERWIWDRLILDFNARGIASDRVELLPRDPTYLEHLAQYQHIDIALDTFPYQGTTTTCEALFMGVPVVTLAGDRHVSRVGASLLTRVGLPELVAASAEDYVRIAVDLAADTKRLSSLRADLRERLEQSPLCDEIGFTRTLETALRQMWQIWCAGEPARVFDVETAGTRAEPGGKEEAAVIALFDQGRLAEAETLARELTARYPEAMFGWKALGTILGKYHRSQAAEPALRRALALAPHDVEAIDTLGKVLLDLDRLDDASDCFRQAVAIQPDFAVAHNNLGSVLERQGKLTEAMDCYSRTLSIYPEYAEAHSNLGTVLKNLGRLDDALACYERALKIQPHAAAIQSNRLFCLNYQADIPRAHIFAEHQAYQQQQAAQIQRLPAMLRDRDPERPLRLGLVSGDLHGHSVAFFLHPILERIDRRHFQIFCYAKSHRRDGMTESFERLSHAWCNACHLTDQALAERIQSDRIDILLDLSGHTSGNALLAFAARPAPVQVTWIGYPNTTGLTAMDYRLVDDLTDPAGEADPFHSERLIRLPTGFLCYRPSIQSSELPVNTPPSWEQGFVTFGSFNTRAKIGPATLDLWSRVLQSVPASRLRLKSSVAADIDAWTSVLADFEAQGIDRQRLEILPRASSYQAHLALYGQIDIALDTFPYHGTTTTCEALFMGVPVVTLAGDRHASRVGVSLLTRIGLPELIATSPEDYVRIALGLATDRERLSILRASLRERLEHSPLRDEIGFTRTLEAALRQMWRIWCRGERPHVFEVQPAV